MEPAPLKRVIQRQLQDPLAMRILEGEFGEGDTILVDVRDGELQLIREPGPAPVLSDPEPAATG